MNWISRPTDVSVVTRAMDQVLWHALPRFEDHDLRHGSLRAPAESRGFTLIELLIIVSILGILAALAVPMMATSSDQARTEAIASNTSHIRAMIAYHSGAGTSALTATGHPTTVEATWFHGGKMPEHAWTGQPMVVQVVSLGPTIVFPAVKVFNPLTVGAANAWYNSTNGNFCVLVPPKASDAETVALFNAANKVSATTISQTTN